MAERASPKTPTKLPSADTWSKHLDKMDAFKAKAQSATGSLGELVKTAEETQNIHRGVAKIMQKLRKMDGAALYAWLESFDDARIKVGLDDLCPQDMFADARAEQSERKAGERGGDNDEGGEGGADQTATGAVESPEQQPPPGMPREEWAKKLAEQNKTIDDSIRGGSVVRMRGDEPKPPGSKLPH